MRVCALIPARGGSKGIKNKNIRLLNGLPLIGHSIASAKASQLVDRVIVSTDDEAIRHVANDLGAETPFLRPSELSDDKAGMWGVIDHAFSWLKDSGDVCDVIVLLQPTSPIRTAGVIDKALNVFKSSRCSSLVSVSEVPHQFTPDSLLKIEQDYLVNAVESKKIYRRQDKSRFFARNGPSILITRRMTIERGDMYGDLILPFEMTRHESIDIDEEEDFVLASLIKDYYDI